MKKRKKKISGKELARRQEQRTSGNYLMTNDGPIRAERIKGGYRLLDWSVNVPDSQ